jgi:hypothetical protein
MAIVSIGNGLYARTSDTPRRRPAIARVEHATPKRDASGKFTKKDKGDKR